MPIPKTQIPKAATAAGRGGSEGSLRRHSGSGEAGHLIFVHAGEAMPARPGTARGRPTPREGRRDAGGGPGGILGEAAAPRLRDWRPGRAGERSRVWTAIHPRGRLRGWRDGPNPSASWKRAPLRDGLYSGRRWRQTASPDSRHARRGGSPENPSEKGNDGYAVRTPPAGGEEQRRAPKRDHPTHVVVRRTLPMIRYRLGVRRASP